MRSAARQKLEKLRRRFPDVRSLRDLDKDLRYPTSDGVKSGVPDRAFFLGEIFWVHRDGWRGCGGFGTHPVKDHHPGLVVRKEPRPAVPIRMVPGTTHPRPWLTEGGAAVNFVPEEDPAWSWRIEERPEAQAYVLNYMRPVSRLQIRGHLATLRYADRMRLQQLVPAVHGSDWERKPSA